MDMQEEMEDTQLSYAGGGSKEHEVLEDDRKLLEQFHQLNVTPQIDSVGDLEMFMRKYGGKDDEPVRQPVVKQKTDWQLPHQNMPTEPFTRQSFQFPKLSTYFGDSAKCDVSWETFKFEVESVQKGSTFSQEQILLGIRRAVKGEAGDIVRRLGTDATLEQIITKLDSTYGIMDTKEMVLRKFYSCVQKSDEAVTSFALRLEELFSRACDVKGLKRSDSERIET